MRIISTAGSALRHGLGATLEAGLVVAIVGALVIGVAVVGRTDPVGASVAAAKGGSSIWVMDPGTARAATSGFHFADTVQVGFASQKNHDYLFARIVCRQAGQVVYAKWGYQGTLEMYGPTVDLFQLGPSASPQPGWSSGSADCTAQLFYLDPKMGYRLQAAQDFGVLP